MKKYCFIIFCLVNVLMLNAQNVILLFSGQDTNQNWVQLNRVTVTNYCGISGTRTIKLPKYVSANPYANGDVMRYVGYADVCNSFLQSNIIESPLNGSDNFNLVFLESQELAKVTTDSVTNVTAVTAMCGGEVIDAGCGSVSARGVCWDTVPHPVVSGSHTVDGNGLGTFTSSITGLKHGTKYYVRAYATNVIGTNYGNEESFTTIACKDSLSATFVDICNGDSYTWRGKNRTNRTDRTYFPVARNRRKR